MKRFLLSIITMSLLFFILVGCSKDEVQPVNEPKMESQLLSEKENSMEPKRLDNDQVSIESETETPSESEGEETTEIDVSDSESVTQDPSSESKEHSASENTSSNSESKTTTTSEKETPVTNEKPKNMVQLSVETGDIRGAIFSLQEVELKEGDTVIDVTKRALGNKVHIRGSNATAYVEGIDNLYEFDHGALSGWLVKVDGVFITSSSGTYQAKKGQKIEWIYATDMTTMIEGG